MTWARDCELLREGRPTRHCDEPYDDPKNGEYIREPAIGSKFARWIVPRPLSLRFRVNSKIITLSFDGSPPFNHEHGEMFFNRSNGAPKLMFVRWHRGRVTLGYLPSPGNHRAA